MNKILLADDAAFMRMTLKKTFEGLGTFEFFEAKDGVEAITAYDQHRPDLTVLDITMPNLDGIGALAKIKELNPGAVVIMCSAMGQEAMVVEAIKLGALDFVVKPFKADRIAKVVKSVFGG